MTYHIVSSIEKPQTSIFEFKYQGNIEAIDINTLLASQLQYSIILNEIKNHLFPLVDLKIKVKSFEKASFDINQIIEISTVGGLFLLEKKEYIGEIFKFLKLYIDIKKILQGKKPDKIREIDGNKIELSLNLNINVNGDGNSIVVDKDVLNVYQKNYTIHKAIHKNGETLENDPDIKGIEIINKTTKEKVLEIGREDFGALKSENAYLNKNLNEKVDENAILYIKKLDINPQRKTKWDFIYDGKKINSVSITDINFLQKVKEGEKFGNGDRLKCKLKTTQKLDNDTGAFLDSKYEIVEVKDIISKEAEQTGLF